MSFQPPTIGALPRQVPGSWQKKTVPARTTTKAGAMELGSRYGIVPWRDDVMVQVA